LTGGRDPARGHRVRGPCMTRDRECSRLTSPSDLTRSENPFSLYPVVLPCTPK
jgi:hypothetical protein